MLITRRGHGIQRIGFQLLAGIVDSGIYRTGPEARRFLEHPRKALVQGFLIRLRHLFSSRLPGLALGAMAEYGLGEL